MKESMLVCFILIAFILEGVYSTDRRCKKVKHFRKNRSYWYDYEGIVDNGIKGTSDNTTKIRISAQLWIDYVTPCEYALQLRNVKLEESIDDQDGFLIAPGSSITAAALEEFPLRFRMEYGLITEIKPALKERRKDILNIKRGILSPLQLDWAKGRNLNEIDVSGSCDVKYDVTKHKNGTSFITKTKDLASCKQRTMAHSNIDAEQYEKALAIYKADSRCAYDLKKKPEIRQAQCDEYYLMNPFSTTAGAGFFTKVRQKFLLRKSKRKKSQRKYQYPEFYSTSLLFDHKHEESAKSSDVTAVEELLTRIVKESSTQARSETANHFTELVFLFRAVDERGFGNLLKKLLTCFDSRSCDQGMADAYWSYFFEALAQCGSTPCVNILANLVMSKQVPANRVDDLISSLNFIQEPSTAMLNTVMGLHKATANPTALLVLGTLMHKLCKHRNLECHGSGPIGNVVRNSEFYLMRLLGNDCSTKDQVKVVQMYHALKAIGNAGRPIRIQDIIMDCIRNAAHMNTSIAAIHALRRMPRTATVSVFLLEILSDRNIDSEKRMESFLIIMNKPTIPEIQLAIDMVNDPGETQQLRSFIRSYLLAISKHRGPNRRRTRDLLRKALSTKNMTDINLNARTSSKMFDKSFFLDFAKVGGSVDGMMLLHPESYIPRTIRLGMNAEALGQAVNLIDFSARMEGLENAVGKLFGEKGYLSKDFITKAFDIPNDIPDKEDKSRSRRAVNDFIDEDKLRKLDDQVNLKKPSPQAAFSLKIFGNEIRLFTMKDIPFMNGEMDDLNIVRTLYSLTKGHSKTFRRSILFIEGSYVVPTIVGLPLSFEMNGSAVVSLNLQGKVSAKNLLFGPKSLTLRGSVLPSITTEISGKVNVYAPFSKAGIRFNARTLASSSIGGEINYEDGKELAVNLDAPDKPIDLFNYTHEMFHVVGSNEIRISGSKRRTKLNICADELYNSTKIFGVEVCTAMSFPVAYHNLDAPFYPLTGPTNVGFRLKKTDMSLKRYHLSLRKSNDLYHVKFGTPGAQNERWNLIKLGITAASQNGVIGATFGNTNQGLMFRYQYDNKTHGLQASLVSNITNNEVSISAAYTNNTDPTTLDVTLALEFDISVQNFNLKNKISFVDTYAYWGFDWVIDNGKQPIKAELKVAYNPQIIFFMLKYGTKNFAIKLQPSFPILVLDMGINWAPEMLNLTLNMDLLKPLITLSANTTKHSYSSHLEWIKKASAQELNVEFRKDQQSYKWKTVADFKNGKKDVHSYIVANGKRYGLRFTFHNAGAIAALTGYPARIQATLIQDGYSKGLKVLGGIGTHSFHMHIKYKVRSDLGQRSLCFHSRNGRSVSHLCFDIISKANKRSLQLELSHPNGKFFTALSFAFLDGNAKLLGSSQREIVDFITKVNEKTVIQLNAISDRSKVIPGRRTLTSLSFKSNFYNVNVDLKLPPASIGNEKLNASGWFLVTYRNKDKETTFEMRSSFNASRRTRQDSVEYIFKHKTNKNAVLYNYEEKTQRDIFLGTFVTRHKTLSAYNGKISLYEDYIKVGEGRSSWNASLKLMNSSKPVGLSNMVSAIQDIVRSVQPVVYLHGVVEKNKTEQGSVGTYYPRTVYVNILGNKIAFTADAKKRNSALSISMAFGIAGNISIDFSKRHKYFIRMDYRDRTRHLKQLAVILRKDSNPAGSWKIRIQHPSLKLFLTKLRMKYLDAQRKMQAGLLKSIQEVLGKGNFGKEMQQDLLADISLVTGVNFLSANVSHLFDKANQQWMPIIRTILKDSIKKDLNKTMQRILESFKSKKFETYDAEALEAASSDINKMIFGMLSRRMPSVFKSGRNLVNKLKEAMKKLMVSSSFKLEMESALRKTLVKLNASKSSEEEMMKVFRQGYRSVIINPSSLVSFVSNLTRIVIKEKMRQNAVIVSDGSKQLLLLLRSHVEKSRDPTLKSNMNKLLEDFENILSKLRFADGENLSKVLASLMNALKSSRISKDNLHATAIHLIDSELRKTGLPRNVRFSLTHFIRSGNYLNFYQNIMLFGLETLNMTTEYDDLIAKVSKNDVTGLIRKAKVAVKDVRLGKEVKSVFERYLVTLDTFDLVTGLFNVSLRHVGSSQRLAKALGSKLASRNLTEFVREAAKLAISNLKIPKEAKSILQEFVLKPVDGKNLKSINKIIAAALNKSQNWKDVVSSFETSNNMAIFLRTFYKNVIKAVKLVPDVENVLLTFADHLSISKLIGKAIDVAKERLKTSMSMKHENNTFLLIKAAMLKYMDQFTDLIPSLLKQRLISITNTVKIKLEGIKREDVMKNATDVLFSIGEKVYLALDQYVSNTLMADIEKYSTASIKGLLGKIFYQNEPADVILKRVSSQVKDKMMFMLRLAAQIFPDEVNAFEKNYISKNGFLHKKLLSDYLKTNFSRSQYPDKLRALFSDFGQRMLSEITNATGGFSTGTGLLNMLKFVRGLNFTDGNTVISSYNKMKNMKYAKWSIPALQQHLRAVLKTIGRYNVGNQTINEHLAPMIHNFQNVLPSIIAVNEKFANMNKQFLKRARAQIVIAKNQFKQLMKKYSQTMRYTVHRWPKILAFASDLLMPTITNIPKIVQRNRAVGRRTHEANRIEKMYYLLKEIDESNLLTALEDLAKEKKITSIDKTLQDILVKVSNSFDQVLRDYITKNLFAYEEILRDIQTEITRAVMELNRFLRSKSTQPLNKFIAKSSKHGVRYLESLFTNSTFSQKVIKKLQFELRPFFNVTISYETLSMYINRVLSKARQSFQSVEQKAVKKWAQMAVPALISNATSSMADSLISVLEQADKIRGFMLRNSFFKNPANYLRQMPKNVMHHLTRKLRRAKPSLVALFVAFETALREKINGARYMYKKHLEATDNILIKANSNLEQLGHYASILKKIDQKGFDKHLSNFTRRTMKKIEEFNDLLKTYSKNRNESENIPDFLSKLTKNTKRWMATVESIIKKKRKSLTTEFESSIQQLESYERKMAAVESELAMNMTRILNNAQLRISNASERVLYILKETDRRRQPVRALILRNTLDAMKNLQTRLKKAKNMIAQYITLIDDTTILFTVPIMMGRSKPRVNIATKHSESENQMKSSGEYFVSRSEHRNIHYPSYGSYGSSEVSISNATIMESSSSLAHSVHYRSSLEVAMPWIFMKPMEPYIDKCYDLISTSINNVSKWMANTRKGYQILLDRLGPSLDTEVTNLYRNQLLRPLQRLSVAATIPAPAEKLQSLTQAKTFWKECKKMFAPSTGSAAINGNHVFTFDGNYVYIPETKSKQSCVYLLARDFRDGNFTFLYMNNQLIILTKDSRIIIGKNKKIEVARISQGSIRYVRELPALAGSTVIRRSGKTVTIRSMFGFTIHCQMELFSCTFEISGFYHNKTLGLLGTNNMEYSDDLRLPNGRIAVGIVEFLQAWQLSADRRCQRIDISDFRQPCMKSPSDRCTALFKYKSSSLSKAFDYVNPMPYLLACQRETSSCVSKQREEITHCPIVKTYVNMAFKMGLKINYPDECVSCNAAFGHQIRLGKVVYYKDQDSVDFVLIIRDSKTLKKAVRNLKVAMQKLDAFLRSSRMNTRYSLIGFDGLGHRKRPHIQTGNGNAWGNINDLHIALNNLQYANTIRGISGLEAIRFASQIEFRPTATKIFLLLDSTAVYTGALKEMIETNNLMRAQGIILNAINRYKFQRNVIGKDSFKRRYHMKIPKGERFRNLALHTADDYVPMVKESRGAIMTIKALMSANEKWMKAFPQSLNKIILEQIKFDKKYCKSCSCSKNSAGFGMLKCTRSDNSVNCSSRQ